MMDERGGDVPGVDRLHRHLQPAVVRLEVVGGQVQAVELAGGAGEPRGAARRVVALDDHLGAGRRPLIRGEASLQVRLTAVDGRDHDPNGHAKTAAQKSSPAVSSFSGASSIQ